MNTRTAQQAAARRQAAEKRRRAARRRQALTRPLVLVGALVAVIAVVAVVAVVVTRSSGSSSTSTPGLEQQRPVQVTGTALAPYASGAATDPAVGQAAPQLQGESFDGTSVAIANDGKAKAVLFVAHWCPHCQREVPLLATWFKDKGPPAGVEFLTVATGTSADQPNYPPSSWLKKVGWPTPVLADDAKSTAADSFGLASYPFFVVIDSQGKVAGRAEGEIATTDLDRLLAKVAPAGK